MGTKKMLGWLAKFWENGLYLFKECRNFFDFMSLERKTFLDCIQFNIYAYSNKIVEKKDF